MPIKNSGVHVDIMHSSAARPCKPLFTFTALLLMMGIAAVGAHAQTQITSCGTRIQSPGQYVLANDLLNCRGNGIEINRAEDVVLNLNGHRITGSNAPRTAGIRVAFGSKARIVGPGVISNFTGTVGSGVFSNASTVDISAVTCTKNEIGFFLSGIVTVHGNIAANNVDGFSTTASGEYSDNMATANTVNGIEISAPSSAQFLHNTVAFNGNYGIETYFTAANKQIIENTVLDNGTYDMYEGNGECRNVWVDNTFGTANKSCIH